MKKKMKRNVIIGKKNNQNLIHVILCLKFLTQVHNNNKNDTYHNNKSNISYCMNLHTFCFI